MVVAPFTGAWIEIVFASFVFAHASSLPSRERGLKFEVAKYAAKSGGRSLHGSVD